MSADGLARAGADALADALDHVRAGGLMGLLALGRTLSRMLSTMLALTVSKKFVPSKNG
jgi:hypothetical protein